MRINVYIDNNVWDFLYELRLDLCAELPRTEYWLCLTREAEFEIQAIPPDKVELKAFIEDTIRKCGVETRSFFGFYDDRYPAHEQRFGGFDEGRWASEKELLFIEQQQAWLSDKKRPTGLYENEADISLAARASNSVVLSLDRKKGPLHCAYESGWKVIFLTDYDKQRESLAAFVRSKLANP